MRFAARLLGFVVLGLALPFAFGNVAGRFGAMAGAGLAGLGVFWIWLCALASLFSSNALFGWPIPEDVPFWAAVLSGLLAYCVVAWPLHAARRAS